MFAGGIVTVFVTDMDRSVRFYTEQLGLRLLRRYAHDFAMIDGGHGLTIGLHPVGSPTVASATKSGIAIGLYLTGNTRDAVAVLRSRGVSVGTPVIDDGVGVFSYFTDPDGNSLYLAEITNEHLHVPTFVESLPSSAS